MVRKVVVVGAGLIGASVAMRLVQRGVAVELVDGKGPAAGASGSSFAWTNVRRRSPGTGGAASRMPESAVIGAETAEAFADLKVVATAEHLALRHELEDDSWIDFGGCLDWSDGLASGAPVLEGRSDTDAQFLSPDEVRLIEPALRLPPEVCRVAYFPFEARLAVPRLVGLLVRQFCYLGGKLLTGAEVVDFLLDGDVVRGVVLADGNRLKADTVVVCAGANSDKVCELAGFRLPLAPTLGMLTITAPSAVRLRTVINAPLVHLRDDGDGRVMIGCYDLEPDQPPAGSPCLGVPEAAQMYERALSLLPALAGTGIEAVRMAQRPMPIDGYPIVGAPASTPGLYVVCAHGGIGMGPLFGRLVAREISAGERDKRLVAFSPDRLTTSDGSTQAAVAAN